MDDRPLLLVVAAVVVIDVSTGSWIGLNNNDDDDDDGEEKEVVVLLGCSSNIVASINRLTMRVNDGNWCRVAFQHV